MLITAVDSSVLLDLITDDPTHGSASERGLRKAMEQGRLVVCECVIAEIRPAFVSDAAFGQFLSDLGIDFLPSTRESAVLAGLHYARYLGRGGKSGRIVPDFLIGAHAKSQADRLLARDRGYLRDYFKDLFLLDPCRGS
jgi:predicted nucleic acid-binding protein